MRLMLLFPCTITYIYAANINSARIHVHCFFTQMLYRRFSSYIFEMTANSACPHILAMISTTGQILYQYEATCVDDDVKANCYAL